MPTSVMPEAAPVCGVQIRAEAPLPLHVQVCLENTSVTERDSLNGNLTETVTIVNGTVTPFVMAGLVPAIHDFLKTWMPGTRPGMTIVHVGWAERLVRQSAPARRRKRNPRGLSLRTDVGSPLRGLAHPTLAQLASRDGSLAMHSSSLMRSPKASSANDNVS